MFLRIGLVEGILLDFLFDKPGYGHGKGGGMDQFCCDCVNIWRLWYTLVYHLFYFQIGGGTSGALVSALLTPGPITKLIFVSGLDSMALQASLKSRTTASFTKAGMLPIYFVQYFSTWPMKRNTLAGSSRRTVPFPGHGAVCYVVEPVVVLGPNRWCTDLL